MSRNGGPRRIYATTREILSHTARSFQQAQLLLTASSLAYTTILSVIPLLAVSFAVFKAFGGVQKLYGALEPLIIANLAEGTSDEVIERIRSFINNTHSATLGFTGFAGLVFTSMTMLNSIENAFNRIWASPNARSLLQKVLTYWFFITLGPIALSVTLGVVTSQNLPLNEIFPGNAGSFLVSTLGFTLIYKIVPNVPVRWICALVSGTLTAVFWHLARWGYGIYATHFVSYGKIYGSLAAVPILLLWVLIIWVIVLTGAAFCCGLQRHFYPDASVSESYR